MHTPRAHCGERNEQQLFTIIFRTCRLLLLPIFLFLSANEHFWRWAGGRACRRDVCKLKFRFGRKMSASLSLFAARGEQVVAHGKRGRETPACLLLAGGVAHCQK